MLFIAPEIALENESVRAALRNGAHEDEVAEILESEFWTQTKHNDEPIYNAST